MATTRHNIIPDGDVIFTFDESKFKPFAPEPIKLSDPSQNSITGPLRLSFKGSNCERLLAHAVDNIREALKLELP
jgi:hypothetical protein